MFVAPQSHETGLDGVEPILCEDLESAADPLAPARGALVGVAFGVGMWAGIGALAWLLQRAL